MALWQCGSTVWLSCREYFQLLAVELVVGAESELASSRHKRSEDASLAGNLTIRGTSQRDSLPNQPALVRYFLICPSPYLNKPKRP